MVDSSNITISIDVKTQRLLTEATAIAGMSSINSFVLSAAIEKAKELLKSEQVLELTQEDAMLLTEALDHPAIRNAKLASAAKQYDRKVQ